MRVLWSAEAEKTFDQIIEYLSDRWTEKEARNFILRTDELIAAITKQPRLFRRYKNREDIRHGILHKK
jgi:plasmid stabilization system protein ParE